MAERTKFNPDGTKPKRSVRADSYHPDYCEQAFVACSTMGATDKNLCKLFGVVDDTYRNWQHKYPEFRAAIVKGKDEYDCLTAEKCLKKKVEGYFTTEITKELDSESGKIIVKKMVKKHVAPSDTSIMYFLNNRNPERWQSKNSVEMSGKMDMLTDDQINKRIGQLLGASGVAQIIGGAEQAGEPMED